MANIIYQWLVKPVMHVIHYFCVMGAFIGAIAMFFTFPVAIVILIALIFTGSATHMEYLWGFLMGLGAFIIRVIVIVSFAFIDEDFI